MNRHRGKFWSIAASFFLTVALAACGGGGDGGGTPPVAAPLAGVFIDSPVAGLGYSAAPSGLSGVTNASGQLNYQPGDQITFNLGGRTVGNTVPGAPVITALQVFGANSIADARVLNLSQLLLTLGGLPTGQNPIQLPATIPAGLPNPLNFSDPNFDAIIQNTLPAGTTLVSEAQATTHLQAQFSTVSVALTGAGAGSGTVASNPAGISCTGATTCPAVFANGTSVTLTATGSGFAGWSGGTGNAAGCTGTGPCVISNLSGNSGVTATFNPPPPVTLSVTKSGSGSGTVTSNPAGINCGSSCSAQFTGGTPVTMTATADAGSTFTGWSNGTGSVTCTGTGTCAATLNATSTVQATFVLNVTQFSVTPSTATANGGGGTVQCSAGGGPAGPCGSYNVGTAVTITASPNTASNFTGWSGGTGNAAGCTGTGPCVINSLTANTTVTANFNKPILSVQVSGTGTVNSSPAGISNCTTNCSAPFDKTTVVTLSASGAGFTGWSGGGCSGTGTCQVTVTSNVSVTATFGGAVSSSPFFQFIQDNDGGPLLVIDPATPGSAPVQVVATQEGGRYVYTASYSGNLITNVRTPYLGYISGGKLWKVTADKTINSAIPGSAGNPPVQVSSESAANNVCNGFVLIDITNINNNRIVYELAGGDNDCSTQSNNVTKMVKFGDNASTPPTVFSTGVVPTEDNQVFDLSTGAMTHIFLVDTANSNTLKVLDTSTGNLTTSQANVGSVRIHAQDTSTRIYLINESKLYVYSILNNSLTELISAAPGSFLVNPGEGSVDSTHLYVADAVPGIVKKIPLTATGAGDVINHYTAPASVFDLQLTENRIVLKISSNPCNQTVQGAEGLVSVRKDNSATVTNLISVATNTCVHNNRTRGSNVFYTKSASGTQTAGVLSEDGTTVVAPITGGQWSGDAGFVSFNPRTNEGGFAKLFLMTNPTPGSVNGATVSVYDWVNPTSTPLVAGTIPSTASPLYFVQFSGETTAALGTGFSQSTANTEIFFLDTAIANSLVRVPTPSARQWLPVN